MLNQVNVNFQLIGLGGVVTGLLSHPGVVGEKKDARWTFPDSKLKVRRFGTDHVDQLNQGPVQSRCALKFFEHTGIHVLVSAVLADIPTQHLVLTRGRIPE